MHDAGRERPGAAAVVEGDREASYMLLNLLSQVRDQALASDREILGKDKVSDALDACGPGGSTYDHREPIETMLVHDVIDQISEGDRHR